MTDFAPMQLRPVSPCVGCRHATYGKPTCTAFPGGIPWPILMGEHDHRAAYPGDGGIRYERTPQRDTPGAVFAAHLYDGGQRRVVTLWYGEDGTVGDLPADPNDPTWSERIALAMQHGTEPSAFVAYWMESMPAASALTRHASLREIEAAALA